MILLLDPDEGTVSAAAYMQILNQDGSAAEACGNATRCVARLLMTERKVVDVTVATVAGLLRCSTVAEDGVRVDMGPPRAVVEHDLQTLLPDQLPRPVYYVNMGNPHCVVVHDEMGPGRFDIATVRMDDQQQGPARNRHPPTTTTDQ